jgi:hypothetical protein
MAIDVATLADYLNVKEAAAGYAFVEPSLLTAQELVSAWVGLSAVPDVVIDRAVLVVAAEMFQQRSAPNGVTQFADMDGVGIRVARDPMLGAYPILRPYVGGGFA